MTAILVVDDEVAIRRALALNLSTRGYVVHEAPTGERALQAVADLRPDAVLLDLGLPGIDGVEVIHGLRGWTSVPIIVLTVRDDERSKVEALDAGADDYVTKPFGMAELLARLRAALRRSATTEPEPEVVVTASFRIERPARRVVGHDGDEIRLTPTEWAIVDHLARHPGRLVTRRQLIDAVWGPAYEADSGLLRVHMAHIRRKLEPDPAHPRHLITDSGMGYRFETGA